MPTENMHLPLHNSYRNLSFVRTSCKYYSAGYSVPIYRYLDMRIIPIDKINILLRT